MPFFTILTIYHPDMMKLTGELHLKVTSLRVRNYWHAFFDPFSSPFDGFRRSKSCFVVKSHQKSPEDGVLPLPFRSKVFSKKTPTFFWNSEAFSMILCPVFAGEEARNVFSLLFQQIILPPCPFNQVASLPDFRSSEAQALREGRRSHQ